MMGMWTQILLIKPSSLNRATLIYNSQRSDPTSKQTQAAAPEIFCYEAVAKVTLGYTKNCVSAASFSTTSAVFIRASLSREQGKEIKVKSNNGLDFLFVVPRAQRSKTDPRQPALQLQRHLGAMPKPPPRVCAAGERCLPELQGYVCIIWKKKNEIRPCCCTGDAGVQKSAGTQIENYLLNMVNLFFFQSVKWLQTLLN